MSYQPFKKNVLSVTAAILAGLGLSAQSLHITSGCRLVMTGSVNLVLNNIGFTNDGTLTPGQSTVAFTGSGTINNAGANISFIDGSSFTGFNNITINKPAGDVALNSPVSVAGTLAMNTGNLRLNNNSIGLGSTGIITGEKEQSHFTGNGTLSGQATLNAPVAANPGNLGLELSTTSNIGIVFIARSVGLVDSLSNTGNSIARRYSFVPAKASLPSLARAVIRFHYLGSELQGQDESKLVPWSSTAPVGSPFAWQAGPSNSIDITNHVITNVSLTQFRYLTLGEAPAAAARKTTTATDAVTTKTSPGTFAVQVLPNPTHDRFTLVLTTGEEKDDIISLYDLSGHLLQHKKVHYEPGTNYTDWDMSAYAAGFYYLRSEKLVLKNIKIVKQ